MAVVDEIIVSLKLDELIASLPFGVEIEIAIRTGAVRQNELAFRIEGVRPWLQIGSLQKTSIQIQGDVSGISVAIADEVVIALIADHLIAGDLLAVNVEKAVSVGTVLHRHHAVTIEVIVSGSQICSCNKFIRE